MKYTNHQLLLSGMLIQAIITSFIFAITNDMDVAIHHIIVAVSYAVIIVIIRVTNSHK